MTTAARRKALICKLLKGIETGDPAAVAVVDQANYIQHNPQTAEGSQGLAELFARISKSNPRVNIVRVFADGDFVFGHTEYDFSARRIGFEVFRFEGDRAVEHWDNIQPRRGPNAAGRSMVSGPTDATDLHRTEANRALVRDFVEQVLVGADLDRLAEFMADDLIQHNPALVDGRDAVAAALQQTHQGRPVIEYTQLHRVLAEGSFVLAVSEGRRRGAPAALYDLFRVEGGVLVEHWDTVEEIAPRSEWKNDNGKSEPLRVLQSSSSSGVSMWAHATG
jgi:predicted SnoaL-like aldol condensation-catalyzing enzyme